MWHAEGMLTKEDIETAIKEYDEAGQRRAQIFAQAAAEGMPQKDIIEASGYSRETVRRITREGQK